MQFVFCCCIFNTIMQLALCEIILFFVNRHHNNFCSKYGFNRQRRSSFLDLLDDINRQTGRLWYFRPYDSDVEPLEAATLRPRQHPPGTPPLRKDERHSDRQANSTHACTHSRYNYFVTTVPLLFISSEIRFFPSILEKIEIGN